MTFVGAGAKGAFVLEWHTTLLGPATKEGLQNVIMVSNDDSPGRGIFAPIVVQNQR